MSQRALAEALVDDDELGEVTSIRMDFDEAGIGPAPLEPSYTLLRTGSMYDATGKLQVSDDSAGTPVWDEPYDLTFSLVDAEGVESAPFTLSGVPVGAFFSVTGPPIIFDNTAYGLQSVDWSQSPDCYGCPIISLVGDTTLEGADRAPQKVTVTGQPVSSVINDSIDAVFESFATTRVFQNDTLEFSGEAIGFEYSGTTAVFSGDIPLGEPTPFKVVVEEDDTTEPEPEPVPTLVIDGNLSGSVSVEEGEYVVLQGQVSKNITVKEGGTLLIQGGVIGRDLKLKGGEVILADATIGRNLKAKGGIIEVGDAVIGRDLHIKGGVEMLGDSESLLVVGRDLRGRTSDSVVLAGNIDVLERVHLRAGDLIVNDTLSAEGDIDLRVRGNVDGGLVVNGDISADTGEIEMRSKGGGGLSVNGSVYAEGEISLRTRRGGDLTISGDVSASAGEIELRVKGGGSLTVDGVVDAAGDVDIRVPGGGTLIGVNGTVASLGIIDLTSGTDLTVNGNVQASVTPGATFGISSVGIHVRSAAINGSVSGSGDIVIDATTTLEINGDVTSQGDVTLDSGSSTTGTGTVSATGHVGLGTPTIVWETSDPFSTWRISGGDGVDITATEDVRMAGGLVESTGGSVTIQARGIVGTWSFDDEAGQDTSGWMTIQSGSNVTLDASEAVDLSGANIGAGGDVVIDAGTTLEVSGDVTSQGDVFLDAGGSTDVDGTVTAEGIIDLTSGTDLTVNGNVQASVTSGPVFGLSSVTISVRSAAINGLVSGSGDVVIDATTTLEVDGTVSAQGDTPFGTGNSVYVNGVLIVFGRIDVNAGTTTEINGNVTSQDDISVDSGTSTTVTGTVSAAGYVDLLGTPTIVMGSDDLFAGDYRITGGQGVNIVTTGTVELTGGTIESPNGITTISALGVILAESSVEKIENLLNRVTGGGGVNITAAEQMELRGVLIDSPDGDVNIQARGIVGSWSFDDTAASDNSSLMIQGGANVTINALETMELGRASIQADQGDITILTSSFRRHQALPLDVPYTEFDAYGSITIEGTNYFELFGTYTWDAGASSASVDPAVVFDSGGRLHVNRLTDPGALLAAVTGG